MSTTHAISYNFMRCKRCDSRHPTHTITTNTSSPLSMQVECFCVCHECVACTTWNSWNINCVFNRNNKSISITCEQKVFAHGVCTRVCVGASCVHELWPRCQQNEYSGKKEQMTKANEVICISKQNSNKISENKMIAWSGYIIVDGFLPILFHFQQNFNSFYSFQLNSISIFSIQTHKHAAGRWLGILDKSLNMTI